MEDIMSDSDSLSQDELDALLSDMGGGDSGQGAANSFEGGYLSDMERDNATELAGAFKSSAESIGVMLGTQSTMGQTSLEGIGQNDAKDRFAEDFVLLISDFSGPVSGRVGLAIPRNDAASIIATATSREAGAIAFDEDDNASLTELIGPVIIAVGRSISGKMGSQIQTSPVQAILTGAGKEFPVQAESIGLITGPLQIPSIMDNDIALMVPTPVLSAMSETAAPSMPAAAGSIPAEPPRKKAVLGGYSSNNLSLLMDVYMPLTVELGRTRMYIKEVLGMGEGSIIELDKLAGEPVDLMVNGKLIAKGEVVVIDENFGVRVTDIVSPSERLKMGI